MTPSELIAAVRHVPAEVVPEIFLSLYKFSYTEENNRGFDANGQFRMALVKELRHDFSLRDIQLIRSLFDQELRYATCCSDLTILHQLCYYLYELGQLEDVFLLYNARELSRDGNYDLMCERGLLSLNRDHNEVFFYVQQRFGEDPALKDQYPRLLIDLDDMVQYPESDMYHFTDRIRTCYGKKG